MEGILGSIRQAPAVTQLLGNVAVTLGAGGLVLMLVMGLWYLIDALQIPTQRSRRGARLFRWGPLYHALAGIAPPEGQVRTALSADAAGEFLFSHLRALTDSWQAIGRFLAYAPLLVGLAGTMLGLSGLLHVLETSGAAGNLGHLQVGGEGIKNLQGVFYGTLGGIVGSLLASTGNLAYGLSADSWIRRAEVFLNESVLPRIPEQRVSLKIEEVVLGMIETRIQVITREMTRALEPLAAGLAANAVEAAEAAKTSSKAFETASRAVSAAGDLEAAAKALSRGIKDNKATTDDLGDAAVALREVARAQAGMEEAFAKAAGRLEESSSQIGTQLGRVSEGVKGHAEHIERSIDAFAKPLEALAGEIMSVRDSFVGLATAVSDRNRIEEAVIESTLGSAKGFQEILTNVRTRMGEFGQEVAALRQQLEQFTHSVTTALGAEFGARVDALTQGLEQTLREVASPVAHGAARMQQAGAAIEETVARTQASLPELENSLGRLAELLQELTRETTAIGERVKDLNATLQLTTNPPVPPAGTTEVIGALRDMGQHLDALRRELARARPTPAASPSPRRGPFRWLFGK